MSATPKVSVLTRTKSRPTLLERAGASLAAQSLDAIEWVIVNDGGDPADVDAVAERFARDLSVSVLHHPESLGMGAAANAALQRSTAPYAIVLDDDDTMAPDALEILHRALDAEPSLAGMVGTSWRVVEAGSIEDGWTEVSRERFYQPEYVLAIADVAYRNPIPNNSMLFRTDVAREIGGIDSSLKLLEDWDFLLRLVLAGDVGACPEANTHFHFREQAGGAEANSGVRSDFDALIRLRNKYLREDIAAGKVGLGFLTNVRDHATQDRLARLLEILGTVSPAKIVRKAFGGGRRR